MLITGHDLLNVPIMSLQTGKELARTERPVINPHNLKIIAYKISGNLLDYDPSYLRTADIREIGKLGIIVDSSDEFVIPDDIIVEKDIYDMEFELEGKKVITADKEKLGKVIEFVVDMESFVVNQIVVKKPLLKSFNDTEFLVSRGQIVEVTDDTIVVKSTKSKQPEKKAITKAYTNPFRQTSTPQVESIDTAKH